MKHLKSRSIVTSLLLFGILALSVQSCKKSKVRKEIAGTWTFVSSVVDGTPDPRTITGTYTFGDCSRSQNKKGTCTVAQDLTIEYMGATETVNTPLAYAIVEKGEIILLDGTEMDVAVSDNQLVLTSRGEPETTVITFNR
ncbi:MAG: hypothetical protein HRT58_10215 [Crocinitomicaceae bacterium]|nr:hypothetical protein [Flavobacteriales bacterium]NQZ36029.1 hypothetical protein [Crocinitomicaceae bacterium]